ncbi:conserved hypothetical protein, partial [Ricinus communis]
MGSSGALKVLYNACRCCQRQTFDFDCSSLRGLGSRAGRVATLLPFLLQKLRFLARFDGFFSQDLKKVRNLVPKIGELIANSWNQTFLIASSEEHSLSIEEEEMLAVRSSDPGLAGL